MDAKYFMAEEADRVAKAAKQKKHRARSSFLTKLLVLLLVGIIYIAETLSDIIQVGWFKYTKKKYGAGRRIFKMAPLHHHFELSGMPETRVVTMYYIITALLCLFALLGFVA